MKCKEKKVRQRDSRVSDTISTRWSEKIEKAKTKIELAEQFNFFSYIDIVALHHR